MVVLVRVDAVWRLTLAARVFLKGLHGNSPCVGALSRTIWQWSEQKAAQPQKKRRQEGEPHAGQGEHADSCTSFGLFFLEEVGVEQSAVRRSCVLPSVPNPDFGHKHMGHRRVVQAE